MVEFGRFEMDTWYYSPFPEPYASQEKLYICEFTLKYFRKKRTLLRHLAKLDIRHPPGTCVTCQGSGFSEGWEARRGYHFLFIRRVLLTSCIRQVYVQ